MTRLAAVLGAGIGAGLVLVIAGLRPAPPRLDALVARLEGTDEPAEVTGPAPRLLRHLTATLTQHLTVPPTDLQLLAISAERLAADKLAHAGLGLLAPAVVAGGSAGLGIALPWTIPTGLAITTGVLLFFVPDLTTRRRAARRRDDFRHAVSSYCDLVRLALGAGAGPTEALEQAPKRSGSWAFARIADAVDDARGARIPPSHALARLGRRIGVQELADLADLADLAEVEGARVADIISAYTRQTRTKRLADLRASANAGTTMMAVPVATIGLAVVLLLTFPQLYLLAVQ